MGRRGDLGSRLEHPAHRPLDHAPVTVLTATVAGLVGPCPGRRPARWVTTGRWRPEAHCGLVEPGGGDPASGRRLLLGRLGHASRLPANEHRRRVDGVGGRPHITLGDGGGEALGAIPGRLCLPQAGGQLGQGPGGLVEGVGGPVQAGLEAGAVDQEGLAGRALPRAGADHERGRSAKPAVDVPQGTGGGVHAPRPDGQRVRVPGWPAHRSGAAGEGG